MKTKFYIVSFLFLISYTLNAQDDVVSSTLLNIGNKLPSFNVPSLNGETLSSNKLKGKVVLINF